MTFARYCTFIGQDLQVRQPKRAVGRHAGNGTGAAITANPDNRGQAQERNP